MYVAMYVGSVHACIKIFKIFSMAMLSSLFSLLILVIKQDKWLDLSIRPTVGTEVYKEASDKTGETIKCCRMQVA